MSQSRFASSSSWSERIGALAFALLFPGYLFYHFSVGLGFIPPFLGGFYGVVSASILVPLLLLAIVRDLPKGLLLYEWLVVLFLAYCVVWALIHFVVGAPYQNSSALLAETLSYMVLLYTLFLAARVIPVSQLRYSKIFHVLFFSMSILVLSQVGEGYVIRVIKQATEASVEISTYQGYARSVLVIALLFLAVSRGLTLVIHIATTTVVLFFIGARAEFAGYLLVVFLLLPYWCFASKKAVMGFWLGIFIVAYVFATSPIPMELFRISELVDLEQSASFRDRQELMRAALSTISANPFFGDYGSDRFGYSHNALSAWVSFGLLGFCLYVGLVLSAALGSFLRVLYSPRTASPILLASYGFNMYSLIMIVMAKHISDPVIAIGWGFYAAMLRSPYSVLHEKGRDEPRRSILVS